MKEKRRLTLLIYNTTEMANTFYEQMTSGKGKEIFVRRLSSAKTPVNS